MRGFAVDTLQERADPYLGSRDGRGSQDARDILLWSSILSRLAWALICHKMLQ